MKFYDGKLMSFSDFCLSEAITPKETEYGTNLEANNGEIGFMDDHHYTFFKNKDANHIVTVHHKSGEVGMATHIGNETDVTKYDDTAKKGYRGDAHGAFGKTMHVVHEIANKNGINKIRFSALNNQLGNMYHRMVKNQHFINSMKERGWKSTGFDGENHNFERE